MADFQIVCAGPGPHEPTSGVLGSSSVPPRGEVRCGSVACRPGEPVEATNRRTIEEAVVTALTQLDTLIAAPALTTIPAGTLTAADLSNRLRILRDEAQATRAGAQQVAQSLKRTIRLVRGDFTGTT